MGKSAQSSNKEAPKRGKKSSLPIIENQQLDKDDVSQINILHIVQTTYI